MNEASALVSNVIGTGNTANFFFFAPRVRIQLVPFSFMALSVSFLSSHMLGKSVRRSFSFLAFFYYYG
jgi:hypothetical protein